MNKPRTKPSALMSAPNAAIANYLELLLREVEEYKEPETKTEREADAVITPVETKPQTETVEEAGSFAPPKWARGGSFQCLLFKVKGLTLGIPLISLNSITEWEGETTRLPGQPEWHIGVVEHRGIKATVVDTAGLLMPEQLMMRTETADVQTGHLLLIGEGRWALACDKLQKPISLTAEEIHWREEENQSPWIVGTIKEHLCVLLDVDAVLQLLRHG